MAGFRTHIATSTALGLAYAGAGALYLPRTNGEPPLASCLLAAGLCSVSGMLPDLDSDSGVPIREMMALSAAVVPMLMMHRFVQMGMSHEAIALTGGIMYLAVRFGIGKILKHCTVHRGMFHSLPAALIAGELAFLVCSTSELGIRYYKAGAVVLGFMSHLVLDEIWSVQMRHGLPHLKKSFGTAIKFWGDSNLANLLTYAQVGLLAFVVSQDPVWMGKIESRVKQQQGAPNVAVEAAHKLWR